MPTRRDFIKAATAAGAALEFVEALRLDAGQSAPSTPIATERSKALATFFGLKYPIFEAPHGRATSADQGKTRV